MELALISPKDFSVSHWAGGKTTQLYIYPTTADYGKRDFLFRVSSATVECEHSDFTLLPNIKRIIMVLKGQLQLHYGEHGECHLLPYQQDTFDGGWNTSSDGQATDFNLMLQHGTDGSLSVVDLAPSRSHTFCNTASLLLLYAAEGSCQCFGEGQSLSVSTGSLAVISGEGILTLENFDTSPCRLICVRITLPPQ